MVYACLGVTYHLHFWQNDRGLSCATVVTRGGALAPVGMGVERTRESAHNSGNSGEENSLGALEGIRTRNLSITSPAL